MGNLDLLGLVVSDSASTRETAIVSSRAVCGLSDNHVFLFRTVAHTDDATTVRRGSLNLPGDEVARSWSRFVMNGTGLGTTTGALSQGVHVNVLSLNRTEEFHSRKILSFCGCFELFRLCHWLGRGSRWAHASSRREIADDSLVLVNGVSFVSTTG